MTTIKSNRVRFPQLLASYRLVRGEIVRRVSQNLRAAGPWIDSTMHKVVRRSGRWGGAAALAGAAMTLPGCALPYLDTAQAAYRVDPVLVQWSSRVAPDPKAAGSPSAKAPAADHNACPTRPPGEKAGAANASTPVDVLCPLDLDAYVFPQDIRKAESPRQTAYERVLACQERIAPAEFGISLGHAIDLARGRRDELRLKAESLPASIKAERDVLKSRATALAERNSELAQKQKKLDDAISAANAPAATNKDSLQEEVTKARSSVADAQKHQQQADADFKVQQGAVDSLESDLAKLPELSRRSAEEIKGLEQQVARYGGGLAPGGTATLDERQQGANCMTLRNQLQEEIIARSTQMCEKHLSDIEATSSLFNATFGFGALTQSALAAVVTGKTLAQTLSTGAAVTTGTQALINKEVFRNTVVPAIKRAIKSERERRLNLMRANQLRPLMEYQAGRAVSEAAAYHEACSFSTGLELIGNDAEKRVEQSIPDIEARVKALTGQIKVIDTSLSGTSTDAEKRLAERSKLRLWQEVEILQSRLAGARQGGAN